jgi:hypothetical protein
MGLGGIQAIMLLVLVGSGWVASGFVHIKHKWFDVPMIEERVRITERGKWQTEIANLTNQLNESTQKAVENFQAGQAEPVNINHADKASRMMACNKQGSGCREREKK